MDVIKEKGELYTLSWIRYPSGLVVPTNVVRHFYYSEVVWIDGFKFAFGKWDSPKGRFDALIEVSTGAIASQKEELEGSSNIEDYIKKFKEKLKKYNVTCGEQIEHFKTTYTIQLWQIKSWAL